MDYPRTPAERDAQVDKLVALRQEVISADYGLVEEEFGISFNDFIAQLDQKIERLQGMVVRTNYMTGRKFMEYADTPYACSPSSESYWCS